MIDRNHVKEVSETIFNQLRSNPIEFFAWGSKNFYYMTREVNGEKYPALKFSVRTPKLKVGGRVIVSYNVSKDVSIVEAIRKKGDEETLIGKTEEVYCDQLHEAINDLIETEETLEMIRKARRS